MAGHTLSMVRGRLRVMANRRRLGEKEGVGARYGEPCSPRPGLLHLSTYSLLLVLTGFFASGGKNAFFQTLNLAFAALQCPHALKFGGAVGRGVQHVCGDRLRAAYGGCVDAEEG